MYNFILTFLVSLAAVFSSAANANSALQPFEPDSLARIIEKQKGKPFVMVLWSLECVYCQASLKTLAQEQRKGRKLNVVTVATDSLSEAQSAILIKKKLESTGISGNAWAFGNAPSEQLRYAIDPKWYGELPRTYWFNARGESVPYSGAITAETIAKMSRGQ